MDSTWALSIITVIITCATFFLLQHKWCIYQPTWYWLMLIALPVNGLINWLTFTFTDLSIIAVCILCFILALVEISLAVLPFFFRDPKRTPPQVNDAVLSPADGKIVYVKNIESGKIPLSDKKGNLISLSEFSGTPLIAQGSLVIGIAMNFLDVHVNRSPIKGTVRKVVHIPGQFLSLRRPQSVAVNERQSMLFENDKMQVGIVQIASRLVRRIVSFVQEGQTVPSGHRIGAIRFGSQVDVIIPLEPKCKLNVKTGDVVRAGISILATIEN